MDIKRAKKEIKDSIEAYLAKDEYGDYMKLPPEKDRVGQHFYKVYKK